jgi:hypothetical protein
LFFSGFLLLCLPAFISPSFFLSLRSSIHHTIRSWRETGRLLLYSSQSSDSHTSTKEPHISHIGFPFFQIILQASMLLSLLYSLHLEQ